MIETRSPTSRLERPGTSVAMSYDGALSARIVVHTDDELDAARPAAALVCDMLRDAQAQGITTVRITLDPSSPMCAEVLGRVRGLVLHGVADLDVRRAGGTMMAEIRLPSRGAESRSSRTGSPTTARPMGLADPDGSTSSRRDACAVQPTLAKVQLAKAHLREQLRDRSGVCGVGLARRDTGYVLRVNLVGSGFDVPSQVDGIPVEVRTTGPLAASVERATA